MFTGMIFIFAPLVVGYLFSISNEKTLELINRSTSYLIYVILSLMGLSLAALDNLGSNLQTILLYTATFFVCLSACNLLALPLIDKALPLQTDSSQKKLPLSSMALESAKLILVVGSGLIAGYYFRSVWAGSTPLANGFYSPSSSSSVFSFVTVASRYGRSFLTSMAWSSLPPSL